MPDFFYKLEIAYKGQGFEGWQSQPSGNAVQDHIERALEKVLRKKVRITGASRTDSGVHAEHQIASFRIDCELDISKIHRSINALISSDISILSLEKSSNEFHPIRSAKAKAYRYRLWLHSVSHPFLSDFVWQLPKGAKQTVNVDAMREAANYCLGYQDFKSFAASDRSAKTTKRRIFEIFIDDSSLPLVDLYFIGEGFLKQMVRTMVGTLVDVGLGKVSADQMIDIISSQDRKNAGKTAPAKGLCLVKIMYGDVLPFSAIRNDSNRLFSITIPDSLT